MINFTNICRAVIFTPIDRQYVPATVGERTVTRLHYSWLICAGGTLLLFCTVGLNTSAFSVYQPYMIAAGGLSNTQGSEVTTLRSLAALLSFLWVEGYYRRTGLRLGVTLAAAGSALAFVLFGLARDFTGYCLAAIVAGVAYGFGGMIPVSMLIDRWFRSHKALALGICAAGTGAATIVAPPILTTLVETVSLPFAFLAEAGFMALASVIVWIIIRNRPEDRGSSALFTGKTENRLDEQARGPAAGRGTLVAMLAAAVLIGVMANPGFSHLSVLFKSEGFDAMTVAWIVSVVGLSLTLGKTIYGQVADRLGAYRSGYVFFGLLVAGEALCCLTGQAGLAVAVGAMLCLGLGLPLATVGLSVWAAEVAGPGGYGTTVKRFQMAYMLGALAFGPAPGMIADATGSYVPVYVLMTLMALTAAVLVQASVLRLRSAARPHHASTA